MKILLLNNSGLVAKYEDYYVDSRTGNFAKELQQLRNEVLFFGQSLSSIDHTISKFGILENKLKLIALPRRKNKLLNYILLYLKMIPAIYRSDLVYIFYPNSLKFAAFFAKLMGKKYGLYIRGMKYQKGFVAHCLYKNAFVVFTVSEFFTQYVNKVSLKELAHTIKPMITLSFDDIVENRIYTAKKQYKLLYLGRMTNDKGIIELLYSIPELVKRGHKFTVDLVGSGEYLDELKKLADKLNINEIVTFRGAVFSPEKIKEYYSNADVYILPTYHEGFPRTLYEAMIFGTPIITTLVGGIGYVMKSEYNCKGITPKSVDSIVKSLSYAFNNYATMGIFAKNATSTVSEILRGKELSHAEHLNKIIKNGYYAEKILE